MLILLPPSEGKAAPRRGRPLALGTLTSPGLTAARESVVDALVTLCTGDAEQRARAAQVLAVPPTRVGLVDLDARVRTSPTARADAVYTGVLYEALDLASLTGPARRRAGARLRVVSSLFGLLAPGDRIPAYRLSGDAMLPGLPGLGSVAGHWRTHLGAAVAETLGPGLLVDLRSSTYAAFWRPPAGLAPRVATVRVLHEVDGRRAVVSHVNKATKGRLVRGLLEDGARPRTPAALAADLTRLGWQVETGPPTPRGTRLDVVVSAP